MTNPERTEESTETTEPRRESDRPEDYGDYKNAQFNVVDEDPQALGLDNAVEAARTEPVNYTPENREEREAAKRDQQ